MYPVLPQSVLLHLEENERLRIQLYRIAKQASQQRQLSETNACNQQMLLQKMAAQLSLFLKSLRTSNHSLQKQSVVNLINNCLIDLQSISSALSFPFPEPKAHGVTEEQIIADWNCKLGQAENTVHLLGNENERLKRQLGQAANQLGEYRQVIAGLKGQIHSRTEELSKVQNEVKNLLEREKQLSQENESLTTRLKEAQQVSSKHLAYIRSTTKEIQLENQKLTLKQREALLRESELINLVEQKQQTIRQLQAALNSKTAEAASFQVQLARIIEQDLKIKELEALGTHSDQKRRLKPEREGCPLSSNTAASSEKENCKPTVQNEESRRFNLTAFTKKLSLSL